MKPFYVIIILLCFTISCDQPSCTNNNPIFDKYQYQSEPYKKELARKIDSIGSKNLSYWFNRISYEHGKKYLDVFIKNDDLCAIGHLLVDKENKEIPILKNGEGYHKAKIKDLTYDIVRGDSGRVVFVFRDAKDIVD